MPWQFVLTDDFEVNGRGAALWLESPARTRHVFLWDLKDGRYLRVVMERGDEAGCRVTVAKLKPEEIVKAVGIAYHDWFVRASTIEGITSCNG
jgi:hypothetical protein